MMTSINWTAPVSRYNSFILIILTLALNIIGHL